MPKKVTLNNKSFIIPEAGDQNYAEDNTDYLVEISEVLNSIQSPLDILQTNFVFANNEATPTNIDNLSFLTSDVSSFVCDYLITRDNGTTKITESGQLHGFQGSAGWVMSRSNVSSDVNNTNFPSSDGDVGVDIQITSAGQMQYTSNDYPSQTIGTITFKARALNQ